MGVLILTVVSFWASEMIFMNAKSMKYFKFCLWYVARKDRETR